MGRDERPEGRGTTRFPTLISATAPDPERGVPRTVSPTNTTTGHHPNPIHTGPQSPPATVPRVERRDTKRVRVGDVLETNNTKTVCPTRSLKDSTGDVVLRGKPVRTEPGCQRGLTPQVGFGRGSSTDHLQLTPKSSSRFRPRILVEREVSGGTDP